MFTTFPPSRDLIHQTFFLPPHFKNIILINKEQTIKYEIDQSFCVDVLLCLVFKELSAKQITLCYRVSMPIDVSNKKTKKKDKRQKENSEEFATPKISSTDSATSVDGSVSSKKKRKRQNSTNGTGLQQNGNLANGTAEETVIAVKSPNTSTSQSHKKSSVKKRRKSKVDSSSLVTSSELLNDSGVKEVDSLLHGLTKKRRSLATLEAELDTTGSAQKRKKNKTNSAA